MYNMPDDLVCGVHFSVSSGIGISALAVGCWKLALDGSPDCSNSSDDSKLSFVGW